MEQQVIDALRRVYRPGDRLATTLGRIAAQLSQSDVLEGAVCAFIGVEDGGVPPADRTATPLGVTRCFPVQYARQVLGALQVTPAADGMSVAAMMRCRQIAKCCAYLIKRDAACALAQDRLDRSLLIAGLCEETWMIDEFIEQAADSDLPIIVHGEFGTEKEEVAILLHAAAPRWEGPFVTVDCTAPGDAPAAWFERAAGGTLFLQGVDELDEALQRQLPGHLRGCQGPRSASGGRAMPRVIASTTADLSRRVRAGRFSRALLSQLDVLSIELAPLRKRRADIGLHVERVLDRHGLDHAQQVTDVLMDALLHYPWPENLQELERVVLRLAVMAAGRPIASADIHRHAPRLLEGHAQAVARRQASPTLMQLRRRHRKRPPTGSTAYHIAPDNACPPCTTHCGAPWCIWANTTPSR